MNDELTLEEIDRITGHKEPVVRTEIEIAWAAGLFEGEGSSYIYDHRARIELTSTDKDVIERFATIMGHGKIAIRTKEHPHKTQYKWYAYHRDDVIEILTILLPWLGNRRKEDAEIALKRAKQIRPHARRLGNYEQ